MTSQFYHHPDGFITIKDSSQSLMITLTEFLTYEPAYTLPAGFIARNYVPLVQHHLYKENGDQYGGPMPYTAGDTYISNLTSYINQHNNPPVSLPQAKADKKFAVDQLSNAKKAGYVSLFSTIMPSFNLDANQIISYNYLSAVPVGFYLRDTSNVNIPLTLLQLNEYNNGIVQLHNLCDVNADSLKDAIDVLTTVMDVQSFDITTGWPTIPYTPV